MWCGSYTGGLNLIGFGIWLQKDPPPRPAARKWHVCLGSYSNALEASVLSYVPTCIPVCDLRYLAGSFLVCLFLRARFPPCACGLVLQCGLAGLVLLMCEPAGSFLLCVCLRARALSCVCGFALVCVGRLVFIA